ncbi:MAG TPA: hypothetical protein VNZ49_12580 [Bacteroidia bacterium]|jgi:hypothetical protein|nr:hypothetical protein [Bacteroidia bacterium]
MKKVIFLISLLAFNYSITNAQTKKGSKTKNTQSGRKIAPKLTLDFISKGGGIDNETFTKVEDFAKNHPKKPFYEVVAKGKEGEKKMYFPLSELTEEEQVAFVDDVKKIISKPEMVLVTSKVELKKVVLASSTTTTETVSMKYRLVVSFISKGAGTDYKTADKVKEFIESHPKKPAFEVKTWGREGEKDYVLLLKELTSDEQKVFVEEIKKLVSSSDLVFVKENETYVKKGR